jgi:hypothetical protein
VPPPPVCEPPTGSPGFTVRWDRVDQGVGDTEHLLVDLQLQLLRLVVAAGGVGVDLVDQMGVVRREGVGEGFDGELVATMSPKYSASLAAKASRFLSAVARTTTRCEQCGESGTAALGGTECAMRISARVDDALRAAAELAAAEGLPVKGEQIAQRQGIPPKFLENILTELKHAGVVGSQRGREGGYWLVRPPEQVRLAE